MNITNSTVNIDNVNAYNNTTSIPSKVCRKCNQIKPLTEYHKNQYTSDKLHYSCKNCRKTDPKKYFRSKFSQAISRAIYNSNIKYLSILSCDSHFLRKWLEFQFDEKMNWRNYGSYFHIDHVKPISLFNIENENDRQIMNHWNNLQPLEKYENMKKSNKYNDETELNHTTKILRFLDHLNKTNPDLCKFAEESYINLY